MVDGLPRLAASGHRLACSLTWIFWKKFWAVEFPSCVRPLSGPSCPGRTGAQPGVRAAPAGLLRAQPECHRALNAMPGNSAADSSTPVAPHDVACGPASVSSFCHARRAPEAGVPGPLLGHAARPWGGTASTGLEPRGATSGPCRRHSLCSWPQAVGVTVLSTWTGPGARVVSFTNIGI